MTTLHNTFIRWFYKIKEPRVLRVIFFLFYLSIFVSGYSAFTDSPGRFYAIGGELLIVTLALSFVIGGVLGMGAILPGTWWLERTGLISIAFGLLLRGILISALGVSNTGFYIFLGEILLLLARFITIRKYDLAGLVP